MLLCLKYLLCLPCFCREPGLLKREESLSLTERCLSSDSIKESSGEVSPYENNSPVLSDGLLCKFPEDSSSLFVRTSRLSRRKLSKHSKDGSGSTSPALSTDKGELHSFQHAKRESSDIFLITLIHCLVDIKMGGLKPMSQLDPASHSLSSASSPKAREMRMAASQHSQNVVHVDVLSNIYMY